MDFAVTLSLLDRTPEQLATLAAIVQRHNLELDVDDHRLASLKSLQGLAEPEPNHKGQAGPGRFPPSRGPPIFLFVRRRRYRAGRMKRSS
jgi:hypothetical protein